MTLSQTIAIEWGEARDGRREGVLPAAGDAVPIVELRGPGPGPTLGLIAGVHGDEVECIDALAGWLPTAVLERGRLLAIPVAHPAALSAGTRLGADGVDLNRVFPGRSDGAPTEQLAHALAGALFDELDLLVTLHSWSRSGETVTYAEYPQAATADADVARRSRELAHALGVSFAEAWEWPAGLLPAAAVRAGVPSAELEVGGLGRATARGRADVVRALEAALRFAGLTDGAASGHATDVRRHWLEAEVAGRASQRAERGAKVRAGDVVAAVCDPHGHALQELVAPADGVVAIHVTYGRVEPGDAVAVLFAPEGGEDGRGDDSVAHDG